VGALLLIVLLPLITCYLQASVVRHGGALWIPKSLADLTGMFAVPSLRALEIYGGWLLLHAFLLMVLPGKVVEGPPQHDGSKLKFKLNGLLAFLISLGAVVGLLAGGVVRATDLIAELPSVLMVATITIVVLSLWFYVWGKGRGPLERSTGNLLYDFFMGTGLNPRVGKFDFKFFFESRMGMASWGALAVIALWAQKEQTGTVSTAMAVVVGCHLWYIVDFFVFESALLWTLDFTYENFGFMLAYGCAVWIPFTFALQEQFLLSHPRDLPWWAATGIVLMHLCGYVIFRDSNLQKQRFRRDPSKPVWGRPPRTMATRRGTQLLLSGWWGLSRHANYMGDLTMALSWCLATGFTHVVPYFYFIYFAPLLINRERRDHALCKEKYGDDWDEYCRRVPWRIVPFAY
jgi:protein-S-isoprenylcysteine O-methyltransferase Ste14